MRKSIVDFIKKKCFHFVKFCLKRLLSWAGKSIEPYGIDYILQKLGFSHARTTIPKWIQRGYMDPMDKVLAVLMLRMVLAIREEPVEDKELKKEKS